MGSLNKGFGSSSCSDWILILNAQMVECERELHHKGKHKGLVYDEHTETPVLLSWRKPKVPKIRLADDYDGQ